MDNYEKNVDKALNAVEKVAGAANRIYIGCGIILANLFFTGFCLWGIYAGYISWKLENEGETATGTVVRLEESNSSEGGCCVYSPVIEFDMNGKHFPLKAIQLPLRLCMKWVRKSRCCITLPTLTPRRSTNGPSAGCSHLLSSLP